MSGEPDLQRILAKLRHLAESARERGDEAQRILSHASPSSNPPSPKTAPRESDPPAPEMSQE